MLLVCPDNWGKSRFNKRDYICKACRCEENRQWYKNNPERALFKDSKGRAKRHNYKPINEASYYRRMGSKTWDDRVCVVTGLTDRLCADHCHKTGIFRQWVDGAVNTIEGYVESLAQRTGKTRLEVAEDIYNYIKMYDALVEYEAKKYDLN